MGIVDLLFSFAFRDDGLSGVVTLAKFNQFATIASTIMFLVDSVKDYSVSR